MNRHTASSGYKVIGFIAIACLAALCLVVFATGLATGPAIAKSNVSTRVSERFDSFDTVQDRGVNGADAHALMESSKLEGATETTDAQDVVHGTSATDVDYVLVGQDQQAASKDKISFAAVGDVFATSMNFPILDAYAGSTGDGLYDFTPYYRAVKDELSAYDVRFANQETPCAGTEDGHEYSGYPIFNTPDSSVHALAEVGFNVVNFNSNHTWDQGEYGIERTQALFAEHPEISLIGSYASLEDRSTVRLVKRNGATIAFLSYSYGDNSFGSDPAAFPNQYYTCQFDKDVMRTEIEHAQSIADAVVVYMHWGSEYDTQPNEQQLDYAQFLADLDVDLVIGSHAHILQPIRTYTSQSGKQVPVVFGLSDFITGWTITDTILSGAFTCDFVKGENGLEVQNCSFAPAIEWSDGGDTYVRFLKDMTADEINANTRTPDVNDDFTYLHTFIDDLHMDVPVAW